MNFRLVLLAAAIIVASIAKGQMVEKYKSTIDSMRTYIDKEQVDTLKIKSILKLAGYYAEDTTEMIKLIDQTISLAKKNKNKNFEAKAYRKGGDLFYYFGTPAQTEGYYNKAFDIYKELNKSSEVMKLMGLFSNLRKNEGKLVESINLRLKCLEMAKELSDSVTIGSCYNALGVTHGMREEHEEALKYFKKSVHYKEGVGDVKGAMIAKNNIGLVLRMQNKFDEALKYHLEAEKVNQKVNDPLSRIKHWVSIGMCYMEMDELDSAMLYLKKSETLEAELNFPTLKSTITTNLGGLYLKKLDYQKARKYFLLSLKLDEGIGDLDSYITIYKGLSEVESKIGDPRKALQYYKSYVTFKDSLFNADVTREITQKEMSFEFEAQQDSIKAVQEKKEALMALEQKRKDDIAAEKAKKQSIILWAAIIGILVLIGFVVFVKNRLNLTRAQKAIIEEQKIEVEHVHQEIKDSINYAERLQKAILPSAQDLNKYLPDNFILFKPKDVVSGDFYWFEHIDDISFIAVADCTGHGVPGAMVSFVCTNALNRSVNEFGLRSPADILNKTRELVIARFSISGEEVKDGMDISLCAIHKNKLEFCGANNPLWIVRDSGKITAEQKEVRSSVVDEDLGLIEIKANKQPVGLYEGMVDFESKDVELFPGDTLYLFSDGFPDQFGGPKGKKFMYKPFKRFLIQLNRDFSEGQALEIEKVFDQWKGDHEQVDDVCVMGVRV